MADPDYYKEFEKLGRQRVEDDLAADRYSKQRRAHAEQWLQRLDQARSDASQASQANTASSAADAAWRAAKAAERAADAAEKANIRANISLAIATVSIIVTIGLHLSDKKIWPF
jgi:ATPase subunit of ABC transporter with duplicated ATPase domains